MQHAVSAAAAPNPPLLHLTHPCCTVPSEGGRPPAAGQPRPQASPEAQHATRWWRWRQRRCSSRRCSCCPPGLLFGRRLVPQLGLTLLPAAASPAAAVCPGSATSPLRPKRQRAAGHAPLDSGCPKAAHNRNAHLAVLVTPRACSSCGGAGGCGFLGHLPPCCCLAATWFLSRATRSGRGSPSGRRNSSRRRSAAASGSGDCHLRQQKAKIKGFIQVFMYE